MKKLTVARLRDVLDYDPETGKFTWLKRISIRIMPGDEAGVVNHAGYRMVRIDGELVMAHVLAWVFVNGVWPTLSIDHIDGNRMNNAIANLREATVQQNAFNKRSFGKTSSWKGVSWDAERQRWAAAIRVNGKKTSLGRFDDEREAAEAYLFVALEYHGEFARAA